jgi:hypothetical protein
MLLLIPAALFDGPGHLIGLVLMVDGAFVALLHWVRSSTPSHTLTVWRARQSPHSSPAPLHG